MSKRTTVILAIVASAMLAYILVFERGTLSSGELDARRGRVLETFVRARVTRLSIERGGTTLVLERQQEEEETLETFDIGSWRITSPLASEADSDSVDGLLSAFEYLDSRRALSDLSPADLATFGLDAPRIRASFTVAGQEVHVLVGGDDPRGDGVYVQSDDATRAWVVGRDFVEALEHDVDHFRKKELFSGVRTRDASVLELVNSDTDVRLERVGGQWHLREPVNALARQSAVEEILDILVDARAARFLTTSVAEAVAEPSRELRIERRVPEGEEGGSADRATPLRLRIGGACPGHDGELVAVVGDEGPVVCVEAESVRALDASVDRLRETRLTAMRDDEVERIEVQRGDGSFEIARDEDAWELRVGEDERAADEQAVADLMSALRASEADRWAPASADELAARGLAQPSATLTLHRSDSESHETILVGATDADGIWVRRGEEAQLAHYAAAAAAALASRAISFRARHLVDHDADDARSLRIVRGDAIETIERRDGAWRVTAPIDAPADRVAARDVISALVDLTVVRFVAERADPAHGLEDPRAVIRAELEVVPQDAADDDGHDHEGEAEPAAQPVTLELRIGAATEGGAFAQLVGDDAVFVVGGALVEQGLAPLVSRDLLGVAASDVSGVTIERPDGSRVALHREGDGWASATGPAAAEPTAQLLDRIAALRATATTRYGDEPLGANTTTVVIERRSGEPQSMTIRLAASPEGDTVLARREDLDVGFRLPASFAQAIASYAP